MKKEYFVLHKKVPEGNMLSETKEKRELYDSRKEFSTLERAIDFALKVLHEQPIVAKTGFTLEGLEGEMVKDPSNPYVIVAYFPTKYGYTDMGGGYDHDPTHEILRCNPDQLEATLWDLAKEKPSKIYGGIELKLFPKDLKETIQKGIEKDGEYKLTKSDQE